VAEQHEMGGDQSAGNKQAGNDLFSFLELKRQGVGAYGDADENLREEKIRHQELSASVASFDLEFEE
jgi:hypothetical protein